MAMQTALKMLWMLTLLLLPASLAQKSPPSDFFSNSLIPGISVFPLDGAFNRNPPLPSFPQSPANNAPPQLSNTNQFRPQQPGHQFPAQSMYLLPYQYQPFSGQYRPNSYQPPVPAQPNQYQNNGYPSYNQNTGSSDRVTPEEILAFLYRIGTPQKRQDQNQYYRVAATYQPEETDSKKKPKMPSSSKPLCKAFLTQYVCQACLAHKPCQHYCC